MGFILVSLIHRLSSLVNDNHVNNDLKEKKNGYVSSLLSPSICFNAVMQYVLFYYDISMMRQMTLRGPNTYLQF